MKPIFILIVFFLAISTSLKAQQHPIDPLPPVSLDSLLHADAANDTIIHEPAFLTRISFIVPALQEEIRLGNGKTLVLTLEPAAAYLHLKEFSLQTAESWLVPAFSLQSRFYTNLEKRQYLHRNTDNFSGNYVGMMASGFYTDHNVGIVAGILAGWQRSIGKRGYINVSAGVGNLWFDGPYRYVFLLNLNSGLAF